MKKYDFLLFESTGAPNHHKDLEMIARMLNDGGYKVAIVDVLNESKYCKDLSIEHISLGKPFSFEVIDKYNIPLLPSLLSFCLNIKYSNYLCSIAKQLSNLANNVYVGSMENCRYNYWLKSFSLDTNVFLWGLRSSRFFEYKRNRFSYIGLCSFLNRKFYWNSNIYYFVSDDLIKLEFLNLGISRNKLIVRPERTTTSLVKSIQQNNPIVFLSIGSLRSDKRIELIVKAFKAIDNKLYHYIIAGKSVSQENYDTVISKAIKFLPSIERRNYRIPENEYNSLINHCDFLILCDKKQPSNVTNGTMNEALLAGKPIIAPNYNPYKFYIEKYGVGLLFDPDNDKSLEIAINKAIELGSDYFSDNILNYQRQFLYEEVKSQFVSVIKKI